MSKVSIGADPEAMLFDNSTGKFIPACGLIGGTKRKPLHFNKGLNKGFTIQEDNVMVEWNIPPAFSPDQWIDYIRTAMQAVNNFVASKGPYSVKYVSQHKFPHKDLTTDQAMQFGCSPDFNAYDNGAEFKPVDPYALRDKNGGWRFAGGHIHVGVQTEVPVFACAAFADYYIGLVNMGSDNQAKRRELYGQPGRYRPTTYGFEYRTPSNYWLRDNDLAFSIGCAAFSCGNFLSNTPLNLILTAYQKMPWGAVRKAIVDQDSNLAQQIVSYVNDENLTGGGL